MESKRALLGTQWGVFWGLKEDFVYDLIGTLMGLKEDSVENSMGLMVTLIGLRRKACLLETQCGF